MDSDASAYESPIGALFARGAEKSREPLQPRRNTATVHERDDQFVVGARDIDSVRDRFTGQSAHPRQYTTYLHYL